MHITVPLIEEKEFKIQMRGYDRAEVDEFLDVICDEIIAMQEQIDNLQARLTQASHNSNYSFMAAAPQRPAEATPSESAQKLIANAQRLYDETIAQAKREADEILANAHAQVEAQQPLQDLQAQRDALQQEVDTLRATARSCRETLLAFLQEQRDALDRLSIS